MWYFQSKILTKLKRSESDTQTPTGPKIWSPYIFYTKIKFFIQKLSKFTKCLISTQVINKMKTYIQIVSYSSSQFFTQE